MTSHADASDDMEAAAALAALPALPAVVSLPGLAAEGGAAWRMNEAVGAEEGRRCAGVARDTLRLPEPDERGGGGALDGR